MTHPLPDSLSRALQEATEAWHDRVENLPFALAMAEGRVGRSEYTAYLAALELLHQAIDEALAVGATDPALQTVAAAASPGRLELLRRDLASLGSPTAPPAGAATLHALVLAQAIRRRAAECPVSLVGTLYVFEGSALGGLLLRGLVRRALGLPDDQGVAYLAGAGLETVARWKTFKARLDALRLVDGPRHRAIEAAVESFTGLHRLVAALGPTDSRPLRELVRELNPEAGGHTIAGDARELDAALRAGDHSWKEFPYYALRYGERGRRFTRSDSAWLAGLAHLPPDQVVDQVDWLARVLAARGMPRWLLERHLRVLHARLVAAVPEQRRLYRSLLGASRHLRSARRAALSELDMRALSLAFDRAVGTEWSERLPRTGALIAAGVADECAGVDQAVGSLEPWLTDSGRFPPRWIDAVRAILGRARALAQMTTETQSP